METPEIRDEEIEIVLGDLLDFYGYDFTNYARASIKRRVNRLMAIDKIPSFAELRYRLKSDTNYLRRFIEEITVNVTEMFRDPAFFSFLRTDILPTLATKPFIRIWHAGCSTGEEVYSMAILLKEANLLDRSLLYATDLNPGVLAHCRSGIFPLANMKLYSENYVQSGGKQDFSKYYTAKYGHAIFDDSLKRRMIVSAHNLVSDSSFNEFQLVICRNVLIYFDKNLQDRVLHLFDSSLEKLGYLALGTKETLRFSAIASNFVQLPNRQKIWKKVH